MRLTTKWRTVLAMYNYRMADGNKARWICQLPASWQAYVWQRIYDRMIDSWEGHDVAQEVADNAMDEKVDIIFDVFYPDYEYWFENVPKIIKEKERSRKIDA